MALVFCFLFSFVLETAPSRDQLMAHHPRHFASPFHSPRFFKIFASRRCQFRPITSPPPPTPHTDFSLTRERVGEVSLLNPPGLPSGWVCEPGDVGSFLFWLFRWRVCVCVCVCVCVVAPACTCVCVACLGLPVRVWACLAVCV